MSRGYRTWWAPWTGRVSSTDWPETEVDVRMDWLETDVYWSKTDVHWSETDVDWSETDVDATMEWHETDIN